MADSGSRGTPVVSTPKEIWGQFTSKAKESAESTIKPGFTLNHDSNHPINPPPVLENTEWPLLHIAGDVAGDSTGRPEGAELSRREMCEQWLRSLSPGNWELCARSLGLNGSAPMDAALDGFAFNKSSDEPSSSSGESVPAKSIFDDCASDGSSFADSISEGPAPDDESGFNGPAPAENDYGFDESAIDDTEDFYFGTLKVGIKKTRSNKFPKDYRRQATHRMERSGSLRMERRRQDKRGWGRVCER
ncbi:hypothetical protein N0V88_007698 [Collariella sp. IMI 366227]|nr:hypothetical protein N0V88_007698 [Collariella sp. IMI 366227]